MCLYVSGFAGMIAKTGIFAWSFSCSLEIAFAADSVIDNYLLRVLFKVFAYLIHVPCLPILLSINIIN